MKTIFLIWPADIAKQSALYPPLGLASLTAVMKQKGYEVNVIDLAFDERWEQLHSIKQEAGIYGISFTSSLYSNAKKCISIIRKNDIQAKIVLGGPHVSVLAEETLTDMDADVVCIGESELSFPEVVCAFEKNAELSNVRGIAFRDNGKRIIVNAERKKIEELDSLPIPDQSLFPYEKYFQEKGFRELSIVTSRGCPGDCSFCQPTIRKMFGNKIRYHGAEYVINHIKLLKSRFKLDFFVVSDDNFVTNRKRVLELCQRIVLDKLNIFWRCQTRVDLLDREIIRMLKRAGCFVIALGVESGSQSILDGLQKGISVKKIKECFEICHEEGMLTHAYLMIGSAGEDLVTIQETVRLLREIKPFSSNICVTTPYPGTHLYDALKRENLIDGVTWDKYDHLLSDTIHIKRPGLDLDRLNEFKSLLLDAQRYPLFKLKCLYKAFMNWESLKRLASILYDNPGILLRGSRLFFKSVFSKGLEMSNPKTKAYEVYSAAKRPEL